MHIFISSSEFLNPGPFDRQLDAKTTRTLSALVLRTSGLHQYSTQNKQSLENLRNNPRLRAISYRDEILLSHRYLGRSTSPFVSLCIMET